MFDLLRRIPLLAQHAREMKIGFGINHRMHDFRMNRRKNLDLVICTPGGGRRGQTFRELGDSYGIVLDGAEAGMMDRLPVLYSCEVATTLVALESKACMTEHVKARPRLYDELSSSYQTIHGDTNSAIAAGLVAINLSPVFTSPERNKRDLTCSPTQFSEHRQPDVAKKVLEKIRELPRRSNLQEAGFDAIGVVLVDCRNDGSPISISDDFADGTEIDAILTYQRMIERISHLYSTRFQAL